MYQAASRLRQGSETGVKPGRNHIEQSAARNHRPLLTTYLWGGSLLLIIRKEASNEATSLPVQVHKYVICMEFDENVFRDFNLDSFKELKEMDEVFNVGN